jgi:hypothetical protein
MGGVKRCAACSPASGLRTRPALAPKKSRPHAPACHRCLVWRQPAQALLTPHVFAALVHALEALNVRAPDRVSLPGRAVSHSPALHARPLCTQVAGQPHGRWQAKCSIYQHAAAAAGAARDAYLVSLEGQALAPGYIVLRRAHAASMRRRSGTRRVQRGCAASAAAMTRCLSPRRTEKQVIEAEPAIFEVGCRGRRRRCVHAPFRVV